MKTSFSTLACPDWTLEEIVTGAVRYGFDGLELRVVSRELELWKLPAFAPSSLPFTRRRIEDQGLSVALIGSSAVFHSADASERQRNFDSALRIAEVAAALGAPAIRVFGDRIQAGNSREQTSGWIVDALLSLARELQAAKLEVWLETHGDFAAADEVTSLLQDVTHGAVGIVWDPANAFAQKNEHPTISASLPGRIRHVHLKDLIRRPDGQPSYVLTGDGEFPFDTMFSALQGLGFERFVSFEWERLWHPELAPPEIALPHFMQWWKTRSMQFHTSAIQEIEP